MFGDVMESTIFISLFLIQSYSCSKNYYFCQLTKTIIKENVV